MSRREDIDNSIWHDPDFEELSLEAQHLYLWAFTNPRCGMAGIYKVSRRAMQEPALSPDQVTDALKELADSRFAFHQDDVLWIRTRVKHLRTKTEQIAKSIASDLARLPDDHPLLRAFLSEYEGSTWLDPHLTLNGGSRIPHEQAKSRPSGDPQPRFQGKGKGSPSTNDEANPVVPSPSNAGTTSRSVARARAGEFDEWLADFRSVTGHTDVRGSKVARDQFNARRGEGFSVDELKLATVGCHSDDFCREHKHDVPETILRASKVQRYIQLGKSPARRLSKADAQVQRLERMKGEVPA